MTVSLVLLVHLRFGISSAISPSLKPAITVLQSLVSLYLNGDFSVRACQDKPAIPLHYSSETC